MLVFESKLMLFRLVSLPSDDGKYFKTLLLRFNTSNEVSNPTDVGILDKRFLDSTSFLRLDSEAHVPMSSGTADKQLSVRSNFVIDGSDKRSKGTTVKDHEHRRQRPVAAPTCKSDKYFIIIDRAFVRAFVPGEVLRED